MRVEPRLGVLVHGKPWLGVHTHEKPRLGVHIHEKPRLGVHIHEKPWLGVHIYEKLRLGAHVPYIHETPHGWEFKNNTRSPRTPNPKGAVRSSYIYIGVLGTPMHQKLEVHDYDKLRLSIPNHVSSVPW